MFDRRLLFCVLTALTIPHLTLAQTQERHVQKRESREPLRYLLYRPKDDATANEASYPLVLFLHGGGEGGDDLEKIKKHGLPKLIEAGKEFPFFVVSPQNPSETQFWDDQQLIRLLDEITAKYPIDASRIYLTGLSRGGYAAWRLAIQNPDRFAALVPISGGGPLPYVKRLAKVPTWVFHGGQDPVIPVEESKRMVEALRAAGGNVKLTVYPDAQHDAWTETYEDPKLYEWLLQHRRRDPPASARRADGYQGIWFTLGQFYGKGANENAYSRPSKDPVFPYGDKYSGGLGTYTAKHTPLAIYCENVKKTFFVYGGTTGPKQRHLLCMISYYDHKTNRVPRPVVVHDKQGVDDPHDNPSLAIDSAGHLWVFVSGRGRSRPGFKYRSTTPYEIDRFELISEEELTYPQPHFVGDRGFLHLFTKYTGVRELYWEQSLGGRQWSDDRKLAGIREPGHARGGHYQTSARDGNRVGTFFNRHPDGIVDRRTDLYYVQTDDNGSSWKTVQGETLTTPLTQVNTPARVVDYASKGLNVYLKDMGFDADGNPVLLYLTSPGHEPGPPNDPRHFRITRWDGRTWQTSTICSTDHNYDMGSLYLTNDNWSAWVPSTSGPQPHHGGGEVTVWKSGDKGATWSLSQQVTAESPRNHNYARRPINATDPFHVFWADGDPTQLSESHLYFANSKGHVYRLPYEMDSDFSKPERVLVGAADEQTGDF